MGFGSKIERKRVEVLGVGVEEIVDGVVLVKGRKNEVMGEEGCVMEVVNGMIGECMEVVG